ncbi:hypothetical protein ABZ208_14040 [Streptomyces sp. NPDC006208]|uniref:hypothetical protein n=1 Tax=Streptomyces sp. NPDC006208 TaxID=3156734 RepID=UPI0033A18DA2
MSIIPSASTGEPRMVPVPIPDRVAVLIGGCMPAHVLQAEIEAEYAALEIGRFRPLSSDEDRQDREDALARMARANKVLAAYNPRLIVKAGGHRG